MLSPASPRSRVLRNISTPVTVVLITSSFKPTISTSSPTLTVPRSIRPEATVPRPVIVNTSSTGIKNGLSVGRSGVGIYSSTISINSRIFFLASSSPSNAFKAEPRTTGMSSPGKSYSLKRSRTSISTRSSNSSSSTKSHLFKNTTMYSTPT